MRRTFAPLLLAVLASCGTVAVPPGNAPTGAGELVLRAETSGGFVPRFTDDRTPPGFSLFGDGQIVVPGPQIEIYPPPALPSLNSFLVSESGRDAIIQAALDADLDAPSHDEPLPSGIGIADAGTTVFTFVFDGTTHRTSAYALGLTNETGARKRLADFYQRLSDVGSWLPAGSVGQEEIYAWTALRVVVAPEDDTVRDDAVKQEPKDWPLATPLAALGAAREGGSRCAAIAGADAETLRKPTGESNTLTPWRSAGKTYVLIVRPMLPDETSC